MKKVRFIPVLALLLIVLSCRENIIEYQDEITNGKVYINSFPSGAEIFFENNQTGRVTPDSLTNLLPGNYTIKLHLVGYSDEIINVKVAAGQTKYINISFGE